MIRSPSRPPTLPTATLASAIRLTLASTAAPRQAAPTEEVLVRGRAYEAEVAPGKFTAPLLDTPKSVTIVPDTLIGELGATSRVDALRTVPGVTFNAGEGGAPA